MNEQPVLREVVVEVPVRGDQVLDAHGVRHEQVGQHQARAEHGPRGEHEMNAIDVDAADQQRERYERRIRRNKVCASVRRLIRLSNPFVGEGG